jgi:deoxyribonuclease V
MQFLNLHPWNLSVRQAIALQKNLAGQVDTTAALPGSLQRVAGVDVSYRRSGRLFHAAVVVLDWQSMATLETATASGEVAFPYVPGLLSFRELPILLQAFTSLSVAPDLILADAQGIAHPRRLGLASHLGLWLDLPTIGCAKSRLCGQGVMPAAEKGAWELLRDDGDILGRILRTKTAVKPLYVSAGHKIDLRSASEAVLHCCCGYRLPEPTRQAHLQSNRVRALRESQSSEGAG